MPRLTKDMYYLAQDIFCRYVAQEKLNPPGDIHQVAQTCIALTHEFFVAFEATQEELAKLERADLEKAFQSGSVVATGGLKSDRDREQAIRKEAQALATGLAMMKEPGEAPKASPKAQEPPKMAKDWQEPAIPQKKAQKAPQEPVGPSSNAIPLPNGKPGAQAPTSKAKRKR